MKPTLKISATTIVLIAILASCSENREKQDDTIEVTPITSIPQEEKLFTSPDLTWKELQGRVQCCETMRFAAFLRDSVCIVKSNEPEMVDSLCFNHDGAITKIVSQVNDDGIISVLQNITLHYDNKGLFLDGKATYGDGISMTVELSRDTDGYLTSMYCRATNGNTFVYGEEMNWKGGRIVEYTYKEYELESTWKRTYTQQGFLESERSSYAGVSEGGENQLHYTYVETDSLGNWTERHVVNHFTSIDYDPYSGAETKMEEPPTYFVERRRLTYY